MRKSINVLFILILIVVGSFTAGWLLHSTPTPATAPQKLNSLPVLGQVPAYIMTNQLGQSVSSTSFHGKVRVVSFLFTYCRGYCPLIAHNFMTLERVLKVAGKADQVQFVSFNVDPENTGPAQMKAFQQQYGWNPDDLRWEFLTGSPEDIHHIVTDTYHVYYKKVVDNNEGETTRDTNDVDSIPQPIVANELADKADVNYDIVHNDLMAIVDTQGRIRKIFGDADRVSDEQLMNVINELIPTAKQAKPVHIVQTEIADDLRIELHVMEAEPFYTTDQVKANPKLEGMLIVGGAKPLAPEARSHSDYHMIVHVFNAKTGKPLSDANVSMTVQTEVQGKLVGTAMPVPVVIMQVIGKGPETTHYGNNVILPNGTYTVTVSANGKKAVFHIEIS